MSTITARDGRRTRTASLLHAGARLRRLGRVVEIHTGGPRRRLVTALGPGNLSHDGKRIAFLRFRDGSIELAVATRDLTSTRSSVKLPAANYWNLRWSPDDRHVALLQTSGGAAFATDLIVLDVETGATRRLVGDVMMEGLTWAPDGSRVVISSAQGSTMYVPPTYNLWSVPLDGSTSSQMTVRRGLISGPGRQCAGQPGHEPRSVAVRRVEVSDYGQSIR